MARPRGRRLRIEALALLLLGVVVRFAPSDGLLRPRRQQRGLLSEAACRKEVPGAEDLVDGCSCKLPRETGATPLGGWRVSLPPGVALRDAGEKGVGLFVTRTFHKEEEVGRADIHLMPCQDLQVGTPLGDRTVACDTHFYDLQCAKLRGLDLLATRRKFANGTKLLASVMAADRAARGELEARTKTGMGEIAVFPEWLVFLNHATEGASTYYGPALYERAAGSPEQVIKAKWVLVARKNLRPNEELTIDYQRGDWVFEALANAFSEQRRAQDD